MSKYKIKTQDEKYDEIELEAYKEHLKDMWTTYFKLKKFNMYTTGSATVDKEIYRVCGPWHVLGKVREGMKKGLLQLREKDPDNLEINELEKYITSGVFDYYA